VTQPSTAREALIAEALGDIARLLDRVEALTPAMEVTRKNLAQANVELAQQLTAFEDRVATTLEQGKTKTVEHITRHVEQTTRQSLAQQTQAMTDSARAIFNTEAGTTLHRVMASLQALAERLEQVQRPWQHWLTHAATAAVAAALATLATYAVTAYLPTH
jgi:methionyl-tRNA synthetase